MREGRNPKGSFSAGKIIGEGGMIQGRKKTRVYIISLSGHQDIGTLKNRESGKPLTRSLLIEVGENVSSCTN